VIAALIGVIAGTRLVGWLLAYRLVGAGATYMATSAAGTATDQHPSPDNAGDFQKLWASLSHEEKLLSYHLALHRLPNPRNEVVIEIEQLVNRDLMEIAPFPRLKSEQLAQFVLRAQSRSDFAELQNKATRSAWKTAGPIVFIVLMVFIAWLSWTAGGVMKAVSAILLATVAFLGQIAQLIAMARSGFSSPPKPGE
jgi:hypothetical protein